MPSGRVVEVVDVVGDRRAGDSPRGALRDLGFEFSLHRPEEALGDSVVPAIALAAHAADDALGVELLPVVGGCVLAATVGVVQQLTVNVATAQRHRQSPGN